MPRLATWFLPALPFVGFSLTAQSPAVPSVGAPSPGASSERELLVERHADKLAAPFLRLHRWHTDLDAARRAAARDGRLILAHFTRSFVPCGTSIRCEREVLSDPAFAAVADRAVLYCHVTAHVDAAHDRMLFATGGSGWPHHVVMDATGRILGRHPSHLEKSPAAFLDLLDAAERYLDIEAEAERARAEASRRQLEAGLAIGALDLDTARRLAARCGPIDAEAAAAIERRITDLEIESILTGLDRFDPADQVVAGEAFHGLWRMGKRPEARNATRDFWGGILVFLETRDAPDLELYGAALGELEVRFGESRGYRRFLDERRARLAELRAAASDGGEDAPVGQVERRSPTAPSR